MGCRYIQLKVRFTDQSLISPRPIWYQLPISWTVSRYKPWNETNVDGKQQSFQKLSCVHWYASVLNKLFLIPFRDNIWNRRQVSVCDRVSFPHDPEIVGDWPSWDPGWGRVWSGEASKPIPFRRYVHPTRWIPEIISVGMYIPHGESQKSFPPIF